MAKQSDSFSKVTTKLDGIPCRFYHGPESEPLSKYEQEQAERVLQEHEKGSRNKSKKKAITLVPRGQLVNGYDIGQTARYVDNGNVIESFKGEVVWKERVLREAAAALERAKAETEQKRKGSLTKGSNDPIDHIPETLGAQN